MDAISPSLSSLDNTATDGTAHDSVAKEVDMTKEVDVPPPAESVAIAANKKYLPQKRMATASAADDPVGSLADFNMEWLNPIASTQGSTPTAPSSAPTEPELSQSSQASLDSNAEADVGGAPARKKAKSFRDIKTTVFFKDYTATDMFDHQLSKTRSATGAPTTNDKPLVAVGELFGMPANDKPVARWHVPVSPFAARLPDITGIPAVAASIADTGGATPIATADASDIPGLNGATEASPAVQPLAATQTANQPRTGRCHNCGQEGHWAGECTLILSKMIAGRESKCALCPFSVKTNKDTIVKLGCGPFRYQWVHRTCAMPHLITLGAL